MLGEANTWVGEAFGVQDFKRRFVPFRARGVMDKGGGLALSLPCISPAGALLGTGSAACITHMEWTNRVEAARDTREKSSTHCPAQG